MEPNIYSINFQDSKEAEKNLEEYKGKYILIVNVASKCGLTPQYEGLKQIQNSYEKDLQVIGFPCNQFMGQEPGTDEEIQTFCACETISEGLIRYFGGNIQVICITW